MVSYFFIRLAAVGLAMFFRQWRMEKISRKNKTSIGKEARAEGIAGKN
jgi:hypothetical protein